MTNFKLSDNSAPAEKAAREHLVELFKRCPIPKIELLANLALFIKRQDLARILFIDKLYQKILTTPGCIMEFGVRWGPNLALYSSLRGIYEPYNYTRKIVGFDTFTGFPSASPEKDGSAPSITAGAYSVADNYEEYLKQIMAYHEQEAPLSHLGKFEIIKGDAAVTLKKYLTENPETIIAFAYFDMDIYQPTKDCLEMIVRHLTKGSIVAFDELNHHTFPGETLALQEVFGLSRYRIYRSQYVPFPTYLEIA